MSAEEGSTCSHKSIGIRNGLFKEMSDPRTSPVLRQTATVWLNLKQFMRSDEKTVTRKVVITLLFTCTCDVVFFQRDLLAVVYEIVHKPIVLTTYRLSTHLFYFRSERSWCETPISGAKDIWDYGWALSPSCLFNVKVLNEREWAFSTKELLFKKP